MSSDHESSGSLVYLEFGTLCHTSLLKHNSVD